MDRRKLASFLKFIKEIANLPGNEWFKNQISETFSSNPEKKGSNATISEGAIELEEKVNLIRQYLAIDLQNLIDYSRFEEPSREQLFRDCIEMCRFEKGTPNHKKNFGEFCRYAHLQAEEMINYFFTKSSEGDIALLDEFLRYKVSNYKPQKKPTSIFHINYTTKLSAFKGLVSFEKKFIDHLYFLNDFRNELSHRNSMSISNEDNAMIAYEKKGFAEGYVDFKKLSGGEIDIFNKGKYIITKRKEEFHLVYEVLEDLKEKVLDRIHKGEKLVLDSNTLGSLNSDLQKLRSTLGKS